MSSMSRDAGLHRTTQFSAAFAVAIFSLAVVAHCSNNNSEVNCSRICVAENSVGIRYGKYCGVGWTGCPGEQPCDDLDACCKIHDDCVGNKGMTDIKCHEKFKRCIKKVHKSGKDGFSKQCPYDTAVPTMVFRYLRSGTKRKLGLQASEIKTNSSSLFAYFNSDDSESEEDLPRKISTSNAHLNTNIS
ncbi:hypothetical protein DVH24_029411 [Malus domestica]|uniref:Uncharacterized protein n=1 Tax=Malus domestica TaxID=3750 RepID=A0A498HV86_MALDO|nr:hypothetical protein DVH24_029411 [Malus domestica]